MSEKDLFLDSSNELNSGLAEHMASLVCSARAHLIGILNVAKPADDKLFATHMYHMLVALENLSSCLEPLYFRSDVFEDDL